MTRATSAEKHALRHGATMAELMDDYVADMEAHKLNGKALSTKKADRSRVEKHLKPKLGKIRVTAITPLQIEQFMNGCTPGSAKRLMQLLGAILSFGIKKGLRSDNPCKGIVKPKDVHKTRRLSLTEYQQLGTLLNDSPTVPNDVFMFLALSGWRSSEARLLRYSELDLERCTATLGETKTGVSVRPLSSAAIDIIKKQSGDGEYVFAHQGKPFQNIHPHWYKLKMPEDVTQHTLRHSFASLAADLGFSDHVIAGMLGHVRTSVTSRYLHLEAALIKAADAVAAETLRLMQTSPVL